MEDQDRIIKIDIDGHEIFHGSLADGVDVLDVVAAHEAVSAGFVVRLVKEALLVFVQLVANRHFGLMACFHVEQATSGIATVILPTFEIDLSLRHIFYSL